MSTPPSRPPPPAPTKERKKARDAREASTAITVIELILAIAVIVSLVVLLGFAFATPNSPAQIRAAPLMLNGFFAVCVISVYVDEQMFDFYTALILGGIALALDIPLLINEIRRWAVCAGVSGASQTLIENEICTNFTSQVPLVPIVAIVVTFIKLIMFVLLIFWFNKRRAYLAVKEKERQQQKKKSAPGSASERERHMKRLQRLMEYTRSNAWRIASIIIGFLQLIAVVFIVILATLFPSAGAFYRATFLFGAAFQAAAEFAFIGRVPPRWTWLILGFAILSLGATVYGVIYELGRFHQCRTGAPVTVVDNEICTNEGFLYWVVPWTLFASAIFSLAGVIITIIMLVRGTDAVPAAPEEKASGD